MADVPPVRFLPLVFWETELQLQLHMLGTTVEDRRGCSGNTRVCRWSREWLHKQVKFGSETYKTIRVQQVNK